MGHRASRWMLAATAVVMLLAAAVGSGQDAGGDPGQPWIGRWRGTGAPDLLTLTADIVMLNRVTGESDPDSPPDLVKGPLTVSGSKMTWVFQYRASDRHGNWYDINPQQIEVTWKIRGNQLILDCRQGSDPPYTETYERVNSLSAAAPTASTTKAPGQDQNGEAVKPKDQGPRSVQAAAVPAATQGPNLLLGTWAGSWKMDTVTYTYTSFSYNADGTYRYVGTFRESKTGTIAGGGTFRQDMEAHTYTTSGNLVRKSTAGPTQFYSYFDVTIAGPGSCTYSVNEKVLTISQSMNGALTTITLTRQ